MSGQITPVLTHVASGFLAGQGLAPNAELLSAINTFRTSGVSGTVRSVISQVTGTEGTESVPSALYSLPIFLTGYTADGHDITQDILTRINALLPAGAAGIQKFATVLGLSSSFMAASFQWKGSMAELGSKGFDDFGLGVKSFNDMASGGAATIFASASGQTDLAQVAVTMNSLGKLYDVSDMAKLGSPANLIQSINNLGLNSVGRLDQKLAAVGAGDLEDTNPVVLRKVLSTITGADLEKIIVASGVTLDAAHSVKTAEDLLEAKKMFSPSAVASLPGGSLTGLGNAMVNVGGNYATPEAAAEYIKKIEIPSLPHLNSVSQPVPSNIASQLTSKLGTGSGPFSTPKLEEMIGTLAGFKHTEAYLNAIEAQAILIDSELGDSFNEAIAHLLAAVAGSAAEGTTIESAVLELNAAISDIANSGNLAVMNLIDQANAKITESRNRLELEGNNLRDAGILASPYASETVFPVTGVDSQSLLNFAMQFHGYGVDRQKAGYNEILTKLATNNQYGDAVKAALIEGRALEQRAAAGIKTSLKADPQAFLDSGQAGS